MEEQCWEFVMAADQTNVEVAVDALEMPQLLHIRLFIQAFCYRRKETTVKNTVAFSTRFI